MAYDIDITFDRWRPALADELRADAEHRLGFALRRFADRVRHVRLRFVDVNGPKRGVDAHCLMIAELTDGQRLVAEATTPWPSASAAQAARRLTDRLRRHKWRTE